MQVNENQFFRQMTIRICSSLDIEKSLQKCLDYLEQFIPVTVLYLHLYDPELCVLRALAFVTKDEKEKKYEMLPIPKESRKAFEDSFSTNKDVIIINDPKKDFVSGKITEIIKKPNTSYIILPLNLEGKGLGSLSIYAKGKDRYSQKHARLLSLLNEPFSIAMSNALRYKELMEFKDRLEDDNRYLHNELLHLSGDKIIGAELGLKEVMETVQQVAPLQIPLLLLGETGVGKEVIANAIHYNSSRKDGPFIKVNCGAIPDNLIDSELFGHEKGAFTGAVEKKRGRFERAHQGTIFLDEIGELPPQAQVRLLRVIQNKEIDRVGGSSPIPVDIRIITATHRNLENMVASKKFREDLWYRLNVFPIMIPPLRHRKEDIPSLVHYFVKRKSRELQFIKNPKLASGVIHKLETYEWPGNIRELENAVERALIQSFGQGITEPISFEKFGLNPKFEPASSLNQVHKTISKLDDTIEGHIRQALAATEWKIFGEKGAAQLLGMNPNTLRSKMKKLGIPFKRKDSGRTKKSKY